MLLVYIVIAILIGSVGSVGLASTLLFLKDDKLEKISSYLLSLAGGTLLGAAFLGMLPKAIDQVVEVESILGMTLTSIVFFFFLEKFILWRTCGNRDCERHQNASAPLILVGDTLHNFIDGVVITAAFFSSNTFGIVVALSVLAHEIPQEVADFGVLIKNGYSRRKALFYNMLSSLSAIIGGIIAYYALDSIKNLIPWVLAISAASFIYIALADLVPQMHKKTGLKDSLVQITLIIVGILLIYFLKQI